MLEGAAGKRDRRRARSFHSPCRRAARLFGLMITLSSVVIDTTSAAAQIAFRSRVDIQAGPAPAAFALAQIDAPRLVIANDKALVIVGALGKRFPIAHRVAALPFVKSLAVGPFTQSGQQDIACITGSAASVRILPGDGNGGFGAAIEVPIPSRPRLLRARPLNQQGKLGLFVAHDAGVSIVLPLPAGGFRAEVVAPVQFAADLEVADVNADGQPDLLVVDRNEQRLVIYQGTGDGTFRDAQPVPTVVAPAHLVVTDVNKDRLADLVVVGEPGLAVHLGNSNRGFAAGQVLYPERQLGGLAVGDTDGDGEADLIVTNRSRSVVTFLMGAGGGNFRLGRSYNVGSGPEGVLVADVTGDSVADVLVLNHLSDSVTMLRGLGHGEFEGSVSLLSSGNLSTITVADFNVDSHLDIAVTSEESGCVSLFLGDGRGGFSSLRPLPVGRQPRGLVAGYFDHDAFPDLAIVNFGSDEVAMLAGNGQGGFEAPRLISVGLGPTAIVRGDFQGKGPIDLAVVNSLSDSVSVLYGDGHGNYPKVASFPVPRRPTFLLVGDLDNDRYPDLVVGNDYSDTVAILRGDGRELGEPRTDRLASSARPLVAEDIDQDGHTDLIVVNESANAIDILPGTEKGAFGTRLTFPVGRDPHAAVAGDFNGDNRLDLAVLHREARTVTILLNSTRLRSDTWRETRLTPRSGRH
ncbi:MAG: hypothetical protein A3J75_03480 [Acidobacteria bacterium RBG_16_68_9]|nr:MAG: hypothetical protein A3J75_03480 [Acidobacteria bacterium RBG_16_68_9]